MSRNGTLAGDIYRAIVVKIRNENTSVVEQLISSETGVRRQCSAPNGKAIIPYILPLPKTNFLTITPCNLYTEDEPILRYLPSINAPRPASIGWFEGTVVGKRSLNVTDSVEKIAAAIRTKRPLAAGESSGTAATTAICKQSRTMESIFCPTCTVFSCGIHTVVKRAPLLKFSETNSCVCPKQRSDNFILGLPSEEERKFLSLAIQQGLKSCVLKLLVALKYQKSVTCSELSFVKFPIKSISAHQHNRNIDHKEFFTPCTHTGACSRGKCDCLIRATACELSCACTKCANIVFCKCADKCDQGCVCYLSHRDCSELCSCAADQSRDHRIVSGVSQLNTSGSSQTATETATPASKQSSNTPAIACNNRNLYNMTELPTSVLQSSRHGYGLFANSFIPSGAFICQYTGEIISDKEAERRGNFYEINRCSYLFNLVSQDGECLYSVDAYFTGGKSRYINHSRKHANIKSDVHLVGGVPRIVFFALRDVYPAEELLFDYHFSENHLREHGIVD